MKSVLKVLLVLLVLVVTLTAKSQTFSVSADSVFVFRQFGNIDNDTTNSIFLTNSTVNPIQVKIEMVFEDVSPNIALVEYNFQSMLTGNPALLDSLIIQGNDSVDFDAIFFPPVSNLPDNRIRMLIYDQNDSLNSYQILTFAAINCSSSNNQIIMNPLGQYCLGDSVFVSANNGFSNYVWSNGGT